MELGDIRTLREAGLWAGYECAGYAIWTAPLNACVRTATESNYSLLTAVLEQSDSLLRETSVVLASLGVPPDGLLRFTTVPFESAKSVLSEACHVLRRELGNAPMFFGRRAYVAVRERDIEGLQNNLAALEAQDHAQELQTEKHRPTGLMMMDCNIEDIECCWTFSVGNPRLESAQALFAARWEADFYRSLLWSYDGYLVQASKLLAPFREGDARAGALHSLVLRILAGDFSGVAGERLLSKFMAERDGE